MTIRDGECAARARRGVWSTIGVAIDWGGIFLSDVDCQCRRARGECESRSISR